MLYTCCMKQTPKKYWFKRRRYGYGWTPVSWQGWLTVVFFVGATIALAFVVLPSKPQQPTSAELTVFLGGLALYIGAMVIVAVTEGPNPRWRWGKKPDDDPDEDY